MKIQSIPVLLSVCLLAPLSQAAVLANYTFGTSEITSLASVDTDTDTTATSLEDYSSQNGETNPVTNRNILTSLSTTVGNPDAGINGEFQTFGGGSAPVGMLSEALFENIYIEFTVAPNGGFSIDYTTFTIDVQKEAGSAAFYGWFLVDQNNNGWDTGDQIGAEYSFTQVGAWETMSFDVSSLTGVASSTSFRIYLGADGTGSANGVNVDNLILSGNLTAIPESSAALLGGLGVLLLLRRRRD